MRSLAEIATGVTTQLLTRAADVVLKDRRRFGADGARNAFDGNAHSKHADAKRGIIAPPVPAFYHHPQSIEDLVRHSVARVLDLWVVRFARQSLAAKPDHALSDV